MAPPKPMKTPVRKPTGGLISVARKVTSGGPTTKTTSSTTDSNAKAVCRRSLSSACAQRARTIAPMFGPQRPHSPARTNHDQVGASRTTAATNATPKTRYPVKTIGRTTLWPRRSTARAHCGLASEPTSARVPATAPARP